MFSRTLLQKFLIFLSVAPLLFISPSVAEEKGIEMEVETAAEQLLFTTIRIEVENPDKDGKTLKGVGTGFIVQYDWDNKSGFFLVTNKHVVKNAKKGRFFFIRGFEGKPLLGETYNIEISDFEKAWFFHPNENIDVAVMPLVGIFEKIGQNKGSIFFKSINQSLVPTAEQEQELDAIEEIVFVGYPNGIFDTTNHIPVFRKGITATPFRINYSGMPKFLIDGSIFPGSSGSPVFIFNKGSFSRRDGGLRVGNRLLFLGLISEGYLRNEEGKWNFVEIPTVLVPAIYVPQMINLGIVIKSSLVFETIRSLLRAKGEIK